MLVLRAGYQGEPEIEAYISQMRNSTLSHFQWISNQGAQNNH